MVISQTSNLLIQQLFPMNFLSRIVNSWRNPSLSQRISQLCESTTPVNQHQSSILLSQLISLPSPQSVILQLSSYLSTSTPISRIKFTSMLLLSEQTNNLNEFSDILHLKLIRTPHKTSNMLQRECQTIVIDILLYFVRSIKREYKQKVKGGMSDSTISMNRLYINFAYKFMNEITYLLNLESSFARVFEKHQGLPYLQQSYTLVLKQLNLLYECFKHSVNYYFTGFDKQQVMENMGEIKELIVTNKQIYRKMRQFHAISDYLIKPGKESTKMGDKLVEYAEMPLHIHKWLSKINRAQTSKLVSTSSIESFQSISNIQSINTMSLVTSDD